jgi:hypothetical protein
LKKRKKKRMRRRRKIGIAIDNERKKCGNSASVVGWRCIPSSPPPPPLSPRTH